MPTQHITLRINSVVGTGDPFDAIMLIPLIADWRVPNHCVFCHADGLEGFVLRATEYSRRGRALNVWRLAIW